MPLPTNHDFTSKVLQGRQVGQSEAVLGRESTALFEHQATVAVARNGPTVVVNGAEELFLGRSEHERVVEVAPSNLNALLSVERLEFREGSDSARRRKGRHALATAILGLERRQLVAKYEVADGPKRRCHQLPKRGNLATGLEAALDDGRALDAVEGVLLVELDEDPPWMCFEQRPKAEHENLSTTGDADTDLVRSTVASDRGPDRLGKGRFGAAAPRRANANGPDRRRGPGRGGRCLDERNEACGGALGVDPAGQLAVDVGRLDFVDQAHGELGVGVGEIAGQSRQVFGLELVGTDSGERTQATIRVGQVKRHARRRRKLRRNATHRQVAPGVLARKLLDNGCIVGARNALACQKLGSRGKLAGLDERQRKRDVRRRRRPRATSIGLVNIVHEESQDPTIVALFPSVEASMNGRNASLPTSS